MLTCVKARCPPSQADCSIPPTLSVVSFRPRNATKLDVADGLVWLSVGIEEAEDIIADLQQALIAV